MPSGRLLSATPFAPLVRFPHECALAIAETPLHKRIRFQFRTYAGIDGLNFRVDGGEKVVLNLKIDDQPAPVTRIFMGEHAVHPLANPFTVHR